MSAPSSSSGKEVRAGLGRQGRQTAALGVGVLAALGLGSAGQAFWPPTATLDCAPSSVRWVGRGASAHARCGAGERPPPAIAGALGLPMPLNDTGEEDLARLPGIGREVARALVVARPFRSWTDVDAVRGVGPARLATLRARTTLDP